MTFLTEADVESCFFSPDIKDRGLSLHETYKSADPFPHIVIDDFLPPALLELCLAKFPKAVEEADVQFDRAQERLKFQYNPDVLAPELRALFYAFNSRPFIKLLEGITGIKGLVPDPYYLGGGFHEIKTGGHLSVHTDFNHHRVMNLERRLNILIYLNEGWREGFGGELELWNSDMTKCVKSIVPVFNRCAIFSTTDSSFHGNPNPVNHPEGRSRRSIALYYYTSTWDETKRNMTTQFKTRPGTGDKPDFAIRRHEIMADFTPPILRRTLSKLKRL